MNAVSGIESLEEDKNLPEISVTFEENPRSSPVLDFNEEEEVNPSDQHIFDSRRPKTGPDKDLQQEHRQDPTQPEKGTPEDLLQEVPSSTVASSSSQTSDSDEPEESSSQDIHFDPDFDSRSPKRGPDKVLSEEKSDQDTQQESEVVGSSPTNSTPTTRIPDGDLLQESKFDSHRPRKDSDGVSDSEDLSETTFSPQDPKKGPDKH